MIRATEIDIKNKIARYNIVDYLWDLKWEFVDIELNEPISKYIKVEKEKSFDDSISEIFWVYNTEIFHDDDRLLIEAKFL